MRVHKHRPLVCSQCFGSRKKGMISRTLTNLDSITDLGLLLFPGMPVFLCLFHVIVSACLPKTQLPLQSPDWKQLPNRCLIYVTKACFMS